LLQARRKKKGICFRASGIQRCFMISVRSMLQKFAEALASRSREGTANVLPLETSIRFPCVTYPKDVSNETAVTVTIRVLAVQFLFISIQKYCTNGSFLMANSLSEFFSAWYFGQTNRSAHATHTGGMKSCHQRGVKNCNPLDQDLTASD